MENSDWFRATVDSKLQKAIDNFDVNNAGASLSEFLTLLDEGYDLAYSFLGNIYEFGGANLDKDYIKARFYYEQCVERRGSVSAYLGLTRIYFYGLGVERDCCKALEYSKVISEELDDPFAHYFLGRIFMDGCCDGKDIVKAKVFFKKSWGLGYVMGLSYLGIAEQQSGNFILGMYYRFKAGVLALRIIAKDPNDIRVRIL